MNNCYIELANAIIIQACKDYRKAIKVLTKDPIDVTSRHRKREIEQFFRSSWFSTLTDLDGELLMQKLKKEA